MTAEALELRDALALFVEFCRRNPEIDPHDQVMVRTFAAYCGRLGMGPLELEALR